MKNKYSFWTRLMRFAYNKIKQDDNFTGIGVPGLRDKENPCEAYAPINNRSKYAIGECESDGHYLCKECKNFIIKSE